MTDIPTAWLTDPQHYAVEQERMRHADALYRYGEYAMFVLMWRIQDFEAGDVARCPRCVTSYGKVGEVFKQPAQVRCPNCFGTTFDGGYRARIVRPSLWDADSPAQQPGEKGDTFTSTSRIQSTADFNMTTDDYAFRADGTRWQVRSTDWDLLRTGFETPSVSTQILGWNFTNANLEYQSSVAYIIPPTAAQLQTILATPVGTRYPPDFSSVEDIRGALL